MIKESNIHWNIVRLHVLKINVGILRWCLISSPSLSVGFSNQDGVMDVARSKPQGAHY